MLDIEEIYNNLYQLSVYSNPDLLLVLIYTNPNRFNDVSQFAINLGLTTPHQIWDYIFELLIRCGYSPVEIPPYNLFRLRGEVDVKIYENLSSGSIIHFAVQSGNIHALDVLTSKYPDLINCMNDRYITPLGVAVLNNNIDLVNFLLNRGADVDASPNRYRVCNPSPIPVLHRYKHIILRALKSKDVSLNIIELILTHTKKDLVFPENRNVLHYIFLRKTRSVLPIVEVMAKYYGISVDELINNNIDKPDKNQIEPYRLAAVYDIYDILEKYSTSDRVSKIWNTIQKLSDNTIKILLPYIDVNKRLTNGGKLIDKYIDANNYEMIKLLIDHGVILDDEDLYKVKDKELRKKIIEYYHIRNQQLVKVPTELWKVACDNKDKRYIDIVREGLRYLKGDAWLSTHDTYDSMCIYLYSDEFKSDVDKYRNDIIAKLDNPRNEYDLIGEELWHYKPEYLVCFNKYCLTVKEVVTLTNQTNQGYVFRNPYTNEVNVITSDDYNRYVYMSKQDLISPIGKLLTIIQPITTTFMPEHEKLMQKYNSEANNTLNENYIIKLANTMNLYIIREFFDNIRQYIDYIPPPQTHEISKAIEKSDTELVAAAIVRQLFTMRQNAAQIGNVEGFDSIVKLITNGVI